MTQHPITKLIKDKCAYFRIFASDFNPVISSLLIVFTATNKYKTDIAIHTFNSIPGANMNTAKSSLSNHFTNCNLTLRYLKVQITILLVQVLDFYIGLTVLNSS